MNHFRRMLLLVLGGTVAILTIAGVPAHADWGRFERDYSALYIFGDSLSDPGNTYAVHGEINQPIWEVIPEEPYDSRRFSNGITWAEHLARGLKTYRGGLPAYRSPWFGNYAFAGARAQGMGAAKPSFGDQVQKYMGVSGGAADPNALYVVQFGGNDIRDALTAAQTVLYQGGSPGEAQAAAEAVLGGAIQAMAYNIGLLRQAGAQNFLVANAPNLGKVPAIQALGVSDFAEALSLGFNFFLDGLIGNFALSGASVYRLDMFSFLDAATEYPLGFGFADAATPCLQVFEAPATGVCSDPDQHLFWDGIHPTRAGHRLLGTIAINAMSLN